ncbi:MAG: glycosyltransferase family 2 protein [Candidatus Riflebacteria bacterium]|nr:glycosyltransferase family 2 protein [Candidatus Riflebacteria bacterium]
MPSRILAFAPATDEKGKIGSVISKIPRDAVDAIVIYDDGSTDGTGDEARAHGARVLRSETRRGVGHVIREGIRHARENGFDVMVVMAGNDKDDPAEIPRLTLPIVDGGYDFIQGSRYLPGGGFGNMPVYRTLATRFVHPLLFSLIAGRRITDSTNGFRAFRLSLFDDARIRLDQDWLDQYELEPYIFYKAIRLGYKVMEVPVHKVYPDWKKGYTKMRPVTGWWSILRPLVFLGLGIKD